MIGAAVFRSPEAAMACSEAIDACRGPLGLKPYREFHFSKNPKGIRLGFLNAVAHQDFDFYAFAVNKSKVFPDCGFQYKDSLYKATCRMLFEDLTPLLSEATVVLDSCGGRDFQRQLKKYLRERINKKDKVIKKINTTKSHSDNLIQLADMLCGSVSRSLNPDRKDRQLYVQVVEKRIKMLRVWPK